MDAKVGLQARRLSGFGRYTLRGGPPVLLRYMEHSADRSVWFFRFLHTPPLMTVIIYSVTGLEEEEKKGEMVLQFKKVGF